MNVIKTEPQPSDREVLAGLVERVTYQNAENGFCVIRVPNRAGSAHRNRDCGNGVRTGRCTECDYRSVKWPHGRGGGAVAATAIANASSKSSGTVATVVGLVTLILTASGAFGEMQSALNVIWKAKPTGTTFSRLVRTRLISLGLVAALGFLLLASLVVSAALAAFGNELDAILPFGSSILSAINFIVSFALISVLFAAIYKFVPDRPSAWRDVILGAVVTTLLFITGKSLIATYIGSSSTVSSYGAAGALIALLLWVYYSAQIFLLGAEFTKAYSNSRSRDSAEI
jgi:YihY family inner membrane protein